MTTRRRRGPAWLRWTLGGWWLVFLFLVVNLRDTFVSDLWPALHDALLALLALVGSWPLLAQIGAGALAALALGGLVWLTILAFRARQEIAEKAAEAEKEAQIKVLHKGNEPVQQQLEQLVELTKERNELLSQRQPPEAPPLSPGVVAPLGLPRPASLVGRAAELDDLMAKLRVGTTMGIFALRGMGGVGKTALAAEAVARLASEPQTFPGGAAWISCEGLTGAEGLADLWARVARALLLEQVAAQPDPQTRRAALAQALARRERLLLALDNIEPDLDAEAALDTLVVAGHTALLLTARHAVAPHRLSPIEIRPLDPPPAAELFAQRLRQVDAARPTAQDEAALPQLLEALGGLPLALELTAAYAGVQRLPLAGVLREVEADGLNAPALKGDPQRALAARFDRSWLKLTARQQRLFAGLPLLAGASFPRAAALALAQATLAKAAPDAAGDLTILVDYALVEPLEGGRLRLHPLLREYAAERLAKLPQAQRERLGDAMVAFWLAYAEAHPGYAGMDALEAEAAGLMGALAWASEHARNQQILAFAHALSTAWNVRGRRDEEMRIYNWATEAAEQLDDVHEQRWMLHSLATTQRQLGQIQEARAGYERALALAQQLGDPTAERAEVHSLAVLDRQQGRLVEARVGYERALALAQQLGDPAAEQAEVHELANLDADQGRLVEARVGCERALALAQQLGDPAAERREVHALAVLDDQERRFPEARAGYERALELARQLGDPDAEAVGLCNFGLFLCEHEEQERGRGLINESLVISERLSNIYHVGKCHQFLAWLDRDEGNRDEASAHYREALRCFEQVQSPDAEEVRADLRELEEGEESGEDSLELTREEAERAAQDAAFLAEKIGLAADDPDILALQEHLRQALAQAQQPPDAGQDALTAALRAFLNTESWEETRAVLEREQALLLSETASQLLAALIERARQDSDEDGATYLELHQMMLTRAREVGIDAAWAEFEAARRSSEERAAEE